jgi:hypothetical protein
MNVRTSFTIFPLEPGDFEVRVCSVHGCPPVFKLGVFWR